MSLKFLPRLFKQTFSRMRSANDLPTDPGTASNRQQWFAYNEAVKQWTSIEEQDNDNSSGDVESSNQHENEGLSNLVLATWNVDSASSRPEARITAITSHVLALRPSVDIIFLQEVSRPALATILDDSRIRSSWYSTEADDTSWQGQSFATMTLMSKSRFGAPNETTKAPRLGSVWRTKYPSHFGRDALCCDIISSSDDPTETTSLRLINVHLDSLQIQPSQRPRQLSIISSILSKADFGLVAGDFNPVLPEDNTLVSDNNLVDAWISLHNKEPGFTWGIDGYKPFPPTRLDKVAMLKLKAHKMSVMHPGSVPQLQRSQDIHAYQEGARGEGEMMPWSDHSGLMCVFSPTQ